jgi:hypothetical protein
MWDVKLVSFIADDAAGGMQDEVCRQAARSRASGRKLKKERKGKERKGKERKGKENRIDGGLDIRAMNFHVA